MSVVNVTGYTKNPSNNYEGLLVALQDGPVSISVEVCIKDTKRAVGDWSLYHVLGTLWLLESGRVQET